LQRQSEATGVFGREYWRAYLEWLYGDPTRIEPATVDRFFEMSRRRTEPNRLRLAALVSNNETTLQRLSTVSAPTLLLWGMRDPVLPYSAAIALRDHLTATRASLLLLDDVGHYPTLEVPERVAAIIDLFLRDVHPIGAVADKPR
jgi:pimeloyl-ACP methyl ester carboxylesterase